MNGGQDLGGRQGFGPISPEPEEQEQQFHESWEQRIFALTLATGMLGQWNIDRSRFARENQPPAEYLQNSYYQNWYVGLKALLQDEGLLTARELESGEPSLTEDFLRRREALRIPDAEKARALLFQGGPVDRPETRKASFHPGDRVQVKRQFTAGHTRIPGYAAGAQGTIDAYQGNHLFPDANAKGNPEAHHLYSVRFDSDALWGKEREGFEVCIDLWEPYLEMAQ